MKYNATKFSISNLIVFLVISFFGVSAHAREQWHNETVYRQGGCSTGNNVCVQVTTETKRVCYQVPDYTAPSGGPSTGQNGGGGIGGPDGENERPEPPPLPPKPESCSANAIATQLASCKSSSQINFSNKTDNCIAAGASTFAISTAIGAGLAIYFRDSSLRPSNKVLFGGAAGGATVGGFLADYVYNACNGHYSANLGVDLAQCELDEKEKIEECAVYN